MKYLICSDIHGSFEACKKIISQFESFSCDKLIILGDTLYHGPRNPLPEGHNPKAVAELLNKYADKIIACRGNCDAEVDQMVLQFQYLCQDIFHHTFLVHIALRNHLRMQTSLIRMLLLHKEWIEICQN